LAPTRATKIDGPLNSRMSVWPIGPVEPYNGNGPLESRRVVLPDVMDIVRLVKLVTLQGGEALLVISPDSDRAEMNCHAANEFVKLCFEVTKSVAIPLSEHPNPRHEVKDERGQYVADSVGNRCLPLVV
jgi:hypothetical protein